MTKQLTEEAQQVHLEVMKHAKSLLQTEPPQKAIDASFSLAPMGIVLQGVFEGAYTAKGDLDSADVLQLVTYLIGEFANFDIEIISQDDFMKDPEGLAKKAQDQSSKLADIVSEYDGDKALEHSAFAGVAQALISYYTAVREHHGSENKIELVGNLTIALAVLFTDDEIEELVDEIKEIES